MCVIIKFQLQTLFLRYYIDLDCGPFTAHCGLDSGVHLKGFSHRPDSLSFFVPVTVSILQSPIHSGCTMVYKIIIINYNNNCALVDDTPYYSPWFSARN